MDERRFSTGIFLLSNNDVRRRCESTDHQEERTCYESQERLEYDTWRNQSFTRDRCLQMSMCGTTFTTIDERKGCNCCADDKQVIRMHAFVTEKRGTVQTVGDFLNLYYKCFLCSFYSCSLSACLFTNREKPTRHRFERKEPAGRTTQGNIKHRESHEYISALCYICMQKKKEDPLLLTTRQEQDGCCCRQKEYKNSEERTAERIAARILSFSDRKDD